MEEEDEGGEGKIRPGKGLQPSKRERQMFVASTELLNIISLRARCANNLLQ